MIKFNILLNKMIDIINTFELCDNVEKILPLFETFTTEINQETKDKISQYQNIEDFFNSYSKIKVKLIYSAFKDIKENLNDFYKNSKNSNFPNAIDEYISFVSDTFIIINLINKFKKIIKNLIYQAKNYINFKINETHIKSKIYTELKGYIENLSHTKPENLVKETPKFISLIREHKKRRQSKVDKLMTYCNKDKVSEEKKKSIIICETETNNPTNNEDKNKRFVSADKKNERNQFSFSKINFGPVTNNINEEVSKEMKSLRVINTNTFNLCKDARYYRNMLELIYKAYKKEIIDRDEKIKLKKMVMKKSEKIENIYIDNINGNFINENQIAMVLKNIAK